MADQRQARRGKRPAPPLTPPALRALALNYVGRYATSSGRLAAYLQRKLRERGWEATTPPEIDSLIGTFRAAGYIDDAGYASAKKASLLRRGYGAARVRQALRHSGVGEEIAAAQAQVDDDSARQAALDFARRKRLGPYARAEPSPKDHDRALAAMIRAGHAFALAREILGQTRKL